MTTLDVTGESTAPPAAAPVVPPATTGQRRWGSGSTVVSSLFGIAITVVAWEILRAVGVLPSQSAPSVFTIVSTMWGELVAGESEMRTALWRTARTWALGLSVATLIAVPIGLVVGMSKWADAATSFLFDFVRPVPAVAFVPVAIVFFGLGGQTETFLIVLASIWPIVYNVRLGIQSIDPLLIETARTLRLGALRTLVRVRLPSLLPAMFTGLRVSAGIAVVLTVVAELVATGRGLGDYIEINRQNGLFAETWAGLALTGIFSYTVAIGFGIFERRVISWHHLSKRSAE